MTTFNLDENHANYQIQAFQPGKIKINDKIFTHSVIITPDRLIENWSPQQVSDLTAQAFTAIISLAPDILLIGTGSMLVFISPDIYGDLINHGMGIEVMNTSAACRTFNALASENRKVAAALIIN